MYSRKITLPRDFANVGHCPARTAASSVGYLPRTESGVMISFFGNTERISLSSASNVSAVHGSAVTAPGNWLIRPLLVFNQQKNSAHASDAPSTIPEYPAGKLTNR